ncbi:hypothetical protein IM40_09590 (plasmid) [Candidatus Paracaedimonas acanthamoebae]|nr:hypothetical protein IM40_09590 [Candidatus Paracaedimonas acanthamoebae]
MLMLGPYMFSVSTAAYQDLKRSTEYNWTEKKTIKPAKVNASKSLLRYSGLGRETVSLNGIIYPAYKGGIYQLPLMRETAGLGLPLPLIGLSGFILGRWIIESIDENQSTFHQYGIPRKIDFHLSLRRYYE